MAAFLVDEDLPRSLARELRAAGLTADDVRDVGLRGKPDVEVFKYATSHRLALLTADMGFANVLQFPSENHRGIVVARFPNELPVAMLNAAFVAALKSLTDEDLSGNTIIVEPNRIRMRRKR